MCLCVFLRVCSHWSGWQRLITVSLYATPFDPAASESVFMCAVCLCVFICGWVFVLLMTCQLPPQVLKVTLPPLGTRPHSQRIQKHTIFILACLPRSNANTNIIKCWSCHMNSYRRGKKLPCNPVLIIHTFSCRAVFHMHGFHLK